MTATTPSAPRPAARRAVEGLRTPHPLAPRLPGAYAGDDFAQAFFSAFDDVLAPVLCVLDCLDAYWNPLLAPEDFLDWLATWVAAAPHPGSPVAHRRHTVAHAVELHRLRGTAHGLAEQVRLSLGLEPGQVEVTDSGGCSWAPTPGGPLPGTPQPSVRLRVRVADPDALPASRVRALADAHRPAHVPCTIEVTAAEGT